MNLREKADQLHSLVTRVLHADFSGYCECYTCSIYKLWREMDCGHWIRRGHSAVRYHAMNTKPQCQECNRYRNGEPEAFEERLRIEYGDEAIDELLELSKGIKQYTDDDYKEMIKTYRQILKRNGVEMV